MNSKLVPLPNCKAYEPDALKLRNFIEMFVEIDTVEGQKHRGTVYTIDPVTESVVLVTKNNEITSMVFAMGHVVKSICIIPEAKVYPDCDKLFVCSKAEFSKEEDESRKQRLKSWLLKNKVPIEEEGEILFIKDTLKVYAPYGVEQCFSIANGMVFERVRNLILNMPVTL